MVLASGEVIKAGGKVVKNVAGYDLCKLFIGSKHSLGIIVEATFKLKPLPEQELILQKRFDSVEELSRAALTMRDSTVDPVVFDVHNLGGTIHMVVGFSGAREDVAEQCSFAERAGFGEGTLAYDQDFHQSGSRPEKVSVLPSKMVEVLRRVAPAPFVARYGNGILYFRESNFREEKEFPSALMNRVKQAYDPSNILPVWSP